MAQKDMPAEIYVATQDCICKTKKCNCEIDGLDAYRTKEEHFENTDVPTGKAVRVGVYHLAEVINLKMTVTPVELTKQKKSK
jgi:hypothetical protein